MSRPLQQKLIGIVEPVLVAGGYELVDLRLTLEQNGWVLRVAVDLPPDGSTPIGEVPAERVDLADCENLSRELSAVLDVDDPIPQAYSLEISSPGIDRPLRTANHFRHFVGSDVKISMAVPHTSEQGERKNFRGILAGVSDDDRRALIDVDGKRFELAIEDIDHAKLVPDWDAVMRGKSGAGGHLSKEPKPVKPGHRPSKHKQQQ
ncbi:MAG: ribosome maturation factor RimP [Proteobacteria bacterium]|nr:ribosome maturation factor RimP [Pseudomonadota bacterium]